jgi:thiamine pyrophosphate-dependent acetolactate synthase large subunit-like protein
VLNRDDVLGHLRSYLNRDDVVVTSLASPSRSWKEQAASQLSYAISDPMGMGPSFALGLALALQADERRVILLEGDGDLLMNLGSLAMVADVAPSNLKVIVLQNGCYETTGCQPTANGIDVDFATIARGAGLARAETIRQSEEVDSALGRLLQDDGLGLLALKVDTAWTPYGAAPEWSIAEDKHQFQRRLREERAVAAAQRRDLA